MNVDVFLKAVRDANRVSPGLHEVARPLTPAARARWKSRNPAIKLPNDLIGVLRKADGIRFGAPEGAGARLLPLAEIRPATEVVYQDQHGEDDALPSSWLALTDDAAGGEILILDVRKRVYLALDTEDPEEAQPVGDRFEHALDWLFARYVAP